MEDRYKILLGLLNRLRPVVLPNKAELYDNLIDVENDLNNSGQVEAEVKPATCEHNFQIARKDYYKPDGGQSSFGITYDQTKTFSTLFCTKCGETKEIISSS